MRTFALLCNCFDDEHMRAQLSDYNYELPPELIASRPLARRDDSRMMVLRRDGETIEHRVFRDLIKQVQPGD